MKIRLDKKSIEKSGHLVGRDPKVGRQNNSECVCFFKTVTTYVENMPDQLRTTDLKYSTTTGESIEPPAFINKKIYLRDHGKETA